MCWVFVTAHGLSLAAVSGLLTSVASLAVKHELQGARASAVAAPGSVVGHMGLVTPRHVGSSWIRDQTYVSCIGRWILTTETKDLMVNPRVVFVYSYRIGFFFFTQLGKQFQNIQVLAVFKQPFEQVEFTQEIAMPPGSVP